MTIFTCREILPVRETPNHFRFTRIQHVAFSRHRFAVLRNLGFFRRLLVGQNFWPIVDLTYFITGTRCVAFPS